MRKSDLKMVQKVLLKYLKKFIKTNQKIVKIIIINFFYKIIFV